MTNHKRIQMKVILHFKWKLESITTLDIGIVTFVGAFLVTNHVLTYIVKGKKITSILNGYKLYIGLITENDNRFYEQL